MLVVETQLLRCMKGTHMWLNSPREEQMDIVNYLNNNPEGEPYLEIHHINWLQTVARIQ